MSSVGYGNDNVGGIGGDMVVLRPLVLFWYFLFC